MGMNTGYLTSNRTASGDEVITPFLAVIPLLKYIPKNKIIWCSCDEDWSAYVQLFRENGYKVINSCLKNGQDFFEYEPDEQWDILITNPPFSLKDKWLERCYGFNKPFALLLPMNSLQGQKRYKLFKQGIELLAFDKRVDYHTNGNYQSTTKGNHFASAYYCRDFLPEKLILEELTKFERPLVAAED
jgi:hypothetical protein